MRRGGPSSRRPGVHWRWGGRLPLVSLGPRSPAGGRRVGGRGEGTAGLRGRGLIPQRAVDAPERRCFLRVQVFGGDSETQLRGWGQPQRLPLPARQQRKPASSGPGTVRRRGAVLPGSFLPPGRLRVLVRPAVALGSHPGGTGRRRAPLARSPRGPPGQPSRDAGARPSPPWRGTSGGAVGARDGVSLGAGAHPRGLEFLGGSVY